MSTIPNPRRERADKDAEKARELVEAAFDTDGRHVYMYGVDRLLAAAQIYATLATRA